MRSCRPSAWSTTIRPDARRSRSCGGRRSHRGGPCGRGSDLAPAVTYFTRGTLAALQAPRGCARFVDLRGFAGEKQRVLERGGQILPCTTPADGDVAIRAQRKGILLPVMEVHACQLACDIALLAEHRLQDLDGLSGEIGA